MKKSILFFLLFCLCIAALFALMLYFPQITEQPKVEENKYGIFYTYYDTGHLLSSTNYENGKINGIQTIYHENGNVLRTVNFVKGFKEGKELAYYKNSLLKSEVPYHNNERSGEAVLYFNDKNFSSKKRPVQAKVILENDKAISGFCYLAGTEHKIIFNEAHLHNFELDMSTPCDIVRQKED